MDEQTQRRRYWAEKMDEARAFMLAVGEEPVAECGEPLGDLQRAVAEAGVEVLFSDSLNGGRFPRLYVLRQGLIAPLLAVAEAMNRRGWVLKIEDAFRTRAMQQNLGCTPVVFRKIFERVQWELAGAMPSAAFMAQRVSALVAYAPVVGTHTSASAIDVSVFDRTTGQEIDRGGPYLEMSERTPMASPFVSAAARANRRAITDLLAAEGFVAYPWEFWHYSQGDVYDVKLNRQASAARYGAIDWDPTTNRVTAMADPKQPLNSEAAMQQAIAAVLAD